MADKRISQLIERVDIANNDVLPIVASGATTTNKVTISSIQDYMQNNLDVGVTSVGITLGTSGTDVSVSGSPITSSGNITINIPDASATARGVVTTGTQTFAGYKIFTGTIGVNQDIQLATQGTALNTFIKNINATGQTSIGSNGFGFNNANNIYFSGSNKGGGIFAFSNTGNQTYTLQDASGTLAFTSDIPSLAGYVTLGTVQTITAQKTFSTSGGDDSVIINHGSGSGIALNITKAGNGEGLIVNKTSGTGNAATITGTIEATTIVKTGGTSSQFLKADGSVDSNTYLTTASASAAYVPYTGANANLDLGQFDLFADTIRVNGSSPTSGSYLGFKHATTVTTGAEGYTSMYTFGTNTIGFKSVSGATNKDFSFDMSTITSNVAGGRVYSLPDASGTLALTSNLSAYLPLTGGTLTGALNGTTGTFSGDLQSSTRVIAVNGGESIILNPNVGGSTNRIEGSAGNPLHIVTSGSSLAFAAGGTTPQMILSNSGNLSLSGALSGTSASFSGDITSSSGFQGLYSRLFVASAQRGGLYSYNVISGGGTDYSVGLFSESELFFAAGGGVTKNLRISSTGAATFSSSVTATNGVFKSTSGNQLRISYDDTYYWNVQRVAADGRLSISDSINGEKFVLTTAGNVGIGTASPSDKLVVNGNVGITDGSFASGESYSLYLGDKNAFINSTFGQKIKLGAYNGFEFGAATNNDLNLSSTWMTITSTGNVGIGTASPTTTLDVNGTIKSNIYTHSSFVHGRKLLTFGPGSTATFNLPSEFPQMGLNASNVWGIFGKYVGFDGGGVEAREFVISRASGGTWAAANYGPQSQTNASLQSVAGSGDSLIINVDSGVYFQIELTVMVS